MPVAEKQKFLPGQEGRADASLAEHSQKPAESGLFCAFNAEIRLEKLEPLTAVKSIKARF